MTLPEVQIDSQQFLSVLLTRRGTMEAKALLRSQGGTLYQQARRARAQDDKAALYSAANNCRSEAAMLEDRLQSDFIPQHSPAELLAPRVFFDSPLFNVCSNAKPRDTLVALQLTPAAAEREIGYIGPELRQSDGRVFLTLLHMLRDVKVGTVVCMDPAAVCRAVLGRYDGASRSGLSTHIQRLQDGLVVCGGDSIQLCRDFTPAKSGPWTVSLDQRLVGLFKASRAVWMSLTHRLAMPQGIATWLLAYIACQTHLIPVRLSALRENCGSDASDKAFSNRLRDALHELSSRRILDPGWHIKGGRLHWRKRAPGGLPDRWG